MNFLLRNNLLYEEVILDLATTARLIVRAGGEPERHSPRTLEDHFGVRVSCNAYLQCEAPSILTEFEAWWVYQLLKHRLLTGFQTRYPMNLDFGPRVIDPRGVFWSGGA